MTETSHRRIAIGDVHGHYKGLMTLLEMIAPSSSDSIYFLGDLIDRGPQSAQVVKFVKESPHKCLLGNHEQMLLNVMAEEEASSSVIQNWLYSGGQATISSYQGGTILKEDVEWLKTLPTYLDLGDVWLVHAGIDPNIPLAKQTADQFCWVRDEFLSVEESYFTDKLIIVGHTITFTLPGVAPGKLAQGEGWLDIDTGAYHPRSGWLTGFDITNGIVYQANVLQNCQRTLTLEESVVKVESHQFGVAVRNKQRKKQNSKKANNTPFGMFKQKFNFFNSK
ncbi:metallophosphoesterase family protein [Mastigocoleus testarum]|uniref:metallophosphoesterase family protein n=1 Tax=Mastigocoleus testarum TaxID=996925 RepID=UPI0007C85C51|nr:metallophosphoesterase family protein [Mastigocoleus testarum]